MADFQATVEAVFRNESGRIIAGLIRASNSFDLAEEAMQDAFTAAIIHWQRDGVPGNPAAWITAAARRKLIDYARRNLTRRKHEDELSQLAEANVQAPNNGPDDSDVSQAFEDDRLRLIFTCCHPALHREAQIALTLRTLGGLSTEEIARAFLIGEATLAQRLARAKRKIQTARIPYEIPPTERLAERLAAVQTVLYLIFNEGYTASSGDNLVRLDLCREAIRLTRILVALMPGNAENLGLLALMLLHDSRSAARCSSESAKDTQPCCHRDAGTVDKGGVGVPVLRVYRESELVTLEEQDRTLWRQDQIAEGIQLVERALGRRNIGPYQLQAAIAAVHAEAKTASETDWKQIASLYAILRDIQPSPVVSLNHAVAVAMSQSLEQGLALIDQLGSAGELNSYHLFHAARADLLRRMERRDEALESYRHALELTTNAVERRYLQRRIGELNLTYA
jgi:RNA polymerase sigma-70 factor (ECF subfamily)